MPNPRIQPPAPALLQATNLAAIPWLRHAFSTRLGGISTAYGRPGDLNLGLTNADNPEHVHGNRRSLVHTITQSESWTLVTARQTHSARTVTITSLPANLLEADGLLTNLTSTALAILTADCVPVLVADTRLRLVAAFHAGWRGTVRHIVQRGIQKMAERFQSHPDDLVAAIGPSIGPCCYQVGELVRGAFTYDRSLIRTSGALPTRTFHLDLWRANRDQLLASGLRPENIEVLAQCTACARTPAGDRLFFSHRAEHGHTGRLMSLIGIDSWPQRVIR